MQFNAAADCLLLFVDDTGHEDLDGQPVYGLGGCSVIAPQLEPFIRAPWREIRRAVKGSPDAKLHASAFPRERAFGELQASIDGKPVPIECFFMPKSAAEPALEVADFIAHAIGEAHQSRKPQLEHSFSHSRSAALALS